MTVIVVTKLPFDVLLCESTLFYFYVVGLHYWNATQDEPEVGQVMQVG
jgi:hypothetical protein